MTQRSCDDAISFEIEENGRIVFRDGDGRYHREDGPAITWSDGTKFWAKHGKWHREGGPAIEWTNGGQDWYKDGLQHRLDGPASIYPGGRRYYWINGKSVRHRRKLDQFDQGFHSAKHHAGEHLS